MPEPQTHEAMAQRISGEPIHIISLGAGVQSSTLAEMASEGEVTPAVVCAINADTKQEPASVYRHLEYLCGVPVQYREDGTAFIDPGIYQSGVLKFPVHIVSAGDIAKDALRIQERRDKKGFWVPSGVPHYSINADGSHGHGPRQCTHDFKLIPIERERARVVGLDTLKAWRRIHKPALGEIRKYQASLVIWRRIKKQGCDPGPIPERPESAWNECQQDALCVAWIGISTDEASRAKESRIPWVKNRYPHLERGVNRDGCMEWSRRNGFRTAPKSACKFCPYHDDDEWIRLRDEEPTEFAQAVKFDYAYREAKVRTVKQCGFKPFLHKSRVPLDKVIFRKSHGKQLTMFNNECEGMCGV